LSLKTLTQYFVKIVMNSSSHIWERDLNLTVLKSSTTRAA